MSTGNMWAGYLDECLAARTAVQKAIPKVCSSADLRDV